MAVHPEILLISAVIRTGEYQVLAAQGISSALFHVCEHEMRWLEEYIARTGRVPSRAAFTQTYPEFVIYKVDDTQHWCEAVVASHKRQAMIDLMTEAADMLDVEDEDKTLAFIEHGLNSIDASTQGMSRTFDVIEEWQSTYDYVNERVMRARSTGFAGIPTSFTSLDDITGGLQGGWFVVVAARLGVGKTWTCVRMAWHAYATHHRVAYFSMEQSRHQITMRLHAFGAREYRRKVINPMDLNRGTGFSLREYKRLLETLQQNRTQGTLKVNDSPRGVITPHLIASTIQSDQPDIVFIDYLTLMSNSTDDWRATARLSGELQGIGQRFNVPIVALSQVNRLGIGKDAPGAEHLSQADAIGQDADLVMTMAPRSKRVMKMRVPKFRHGPSGVGWDAKFSPATGEYEEISEQEAADLIEQDGEVD